jgi:hypothetical protein
VGAPISLASLSSNDNPSCQSSLNPLDSFLSSGKPFYKIGLKILLIIFHLHTCHNVTSLRYVPFEVVLNIYKKK